MKIHGSRGPTGKQPQAKVQKTGAAGKAAGTKVSGASGKTGGADRIEVSDRAKEVADLKAGIDALPEMRTDKVQEIEKTVKDGKYKVDSMKVAEKMIDEMT